MHVMLFEVFVASCLISVSSARSAADYKEQRMHDDGVQSLLSLTVKSQLELQSEYWLNSAKEFVAKKSKVKPNKNIAKNIVFFLGDGMSVPTMAASRVFIGGEEKKLSFEEFPYVGMAKTYCIDYQVSESACTSTAYLSGVKANYHTIGLSPKVRKADCYAHEDKSLRTSSFAKWALDAGKSAGIITTTAIVDATPAGVYAHVSNRAWKTNNKITDDGCDESQIDDIAKQLIYGDVGSQLKVIMGGGRRYLLDKNMRDEEGADGARTDGKNLIQEWINLQQQNETRTYVWNKVCSYFCK